MKPGRWCRLFNELLLLSQLPKLTFIFKLLWIQSPGQRFKSCFAWKIRLAFYDFKMQVTRRWWYIATAESSCGKSKLLDTSRPSATRALSNDVKLLHISAGSLVVVFFHLFIYILQQLTMIFLTNWLIVWSRWQQIVRNAHHKFKEPNMTSSYI